jgi:tRNA G18 (ribose-2'-O)-methylase SpoU
MRNQTRRQRYNNKINTAKKFPISIATVNFMCDENLAYVVRTAACFGLTDVHVIGAIPEYKEMRRYSGTLNEYVQVYQYKNPHDFLVAMKNKGIKLVSLELCDDSQNIEDYSFNFNNHFCIVTGNETTGVPVEILNNSEKIYIPMDGVGFSLNTSQAANIAVYEAVKQHKRLNAETIDKVDNVSFTKKENYLFN